MDSDSSGTFAPDTEFSDDRNSPQLVESRMAMSASLQELNLRMGDSSDDDGFEDRARDLAEQVATERSHRSAVPHHHTDEVIPLPENSEQFDNDISMNLLQECRKQQVELKSYERAIKEREHDLAELRHEVALLHANLNAKAAAEQEFKDENWELQVKLDEANTQINKHAQKHTSAPTQVVDRDYLKEIEVLRSREAEFVAQITALTSKSNAQIDRLQDQLAKTEEQLYVVQSSEQSVDQPEPVAVSEHKSIFDDIELPPNFDKSPPISPIKNMGATVHADTANSAVLQLQRQVYTLRQQLAKERARHSGGGADTSRDNATNTPVKKSGKQSKHSSARVRHHKQQRRSGHTGHTQAPSDDEVSSFDEVDMEELEMPHDDEVEVPETPFEDPIIDTTLNFGQADFFESLQKEGIAVESGPSAELLPPASSLASEFLSPEDIAARAAELGLTVVDTEALDTLQRKATAPTNEDLQELCAIRGYVPVHAQEHQELVEPSLNNMARFAQAHNMELCSREELEKLKNPKITLKDLGSMAQKHSSVVLSEQEYQEMVQTLDRNSRLLAKRELANASVAERRDHFASLLKSSAESVKSPTSHRVSQTLSTLGYVPVQNEDYKKLIASQSVFTPTKTDIIRGARAFGLATVSLDEYREMVRRPSTPSTPSRGGGSGSPKQRSSPKKFSAKMLDENTDEEDVRVVPADYLESLRSLVENPTKEELVKSAEKLNLSVIENTPQALEQYAKSQGVRLSSKSAEEEFQEFVEKQHIPTTKEQYIQRGKELGLVSPPQDTDILERARGLGLVDAPTDDDHLARARELGLVVAPTDDEIISRGKSLGLSSPLTESEILAHAHKVEPVDSLIARLAGHGYVSLGQDHHNELQRQLTEPTFEELEQKAAASGVWVSRKTAEEEFNDRVSELGIPLTDEATKSKARELGLVDPINDDEVISRGQSLGLAYPLSSAQITEAARELGLVDPLGEDEIRSRGLELGLVHPPSDVEVTERARKLGLVDAIDDSEVISRASNLGLAYPLDGVELGNKARSELGLVDPLGDDEIQSRALGLGLVHPPNEEQIKLGAKTLGLVDPLTREEIIEQARSHGLVDPLGDAEIVERSRALGLVDPMDDAQVVARAKPLLDLQSLQELVSNHGHSTIEHETFRELQRKATEPTPQEVASFAALYGQVSVPEVEHVEYVRKANEPSFDEVVELAKKHNSRVTHKTIDQEFGEVINQRGLAAVDEHQYKELVRKTTAPTMEDVMHLGSLANATVLHPDAHAELVRKSTEPTHEEIAAVLSGQNRVHVPRHEYDEAVRKATQPSLEELRNSAELLDHRILPTAAVDNLENPTIDDLARHASKLNSVVVDRDVYAEVDRKATEPTLSEIEEFVASLNSHVILSKPTHSELLARSTELKLKADAENARTLQDVIKEANEYGYTAIATEDHDNLQRKVSRPTESELKAHAKKLGRVTLGSEEHAELCRKVASPSLEEVVVHAKSHNIPTTENEIKLKAREFGLVDPITPQQINAAAKKSGLVDPLTEDEILDAARALGLVDELTTDEIIEKALGLGLIRPLSDSEIIDRARKLGLVDKLSDDEIIAKAQALGLAHPLSDSEIREKGLGLGLAIPLENDEIKSRALDLGLAHPLAEEEVKSKALDLGLVHPLSNNEIKSRALDLGLVHPLSAEELKSEGYKLGLVDEPSDKAITEKALGLGLAKPLTNKQIKVKAGDLGLVNPPTDDEIKSKAKSLGLISPLEDTEIIAKAKTLGLISPLSDQEIMSKAKTLGLVDAPTKEETVAKAKSLGLISPLSDGDILAKAKSLGLVDAPTDEDILSKSRGLGLTDPLDDDQIVSKAKSLGLVEPLADEEIKARSLNLGMIDPSDEQKVRSAATSSLGMVSPPTNHEILQKASDLGLVEPLDDNQVKAKAQKLGLVLPPSKEEYIQKAKSLGLISPPQNQEILAKARDLGLVDAPEKADIIAQAREYGLINQPSADDIRSRALSLGLVDPKDKHTFAKRAIEYGLIDPKDEDQVAAAGFARPMTDKEIKARARSMGLVESLSDDQIVFKARNLGLDRPLDKHQILAEAQKLGYTKKLSNDEIKSAAAAIGLPVTNAKIIEAARGMGMRYPPSDAEIIAKAKVMGFVKQSEFNAKSLPPLHESPQSSSGGSQSVYQPTSPYVYKPSKESDARKADAVKRAHAAEQRAMRSPVRFEGPTYSFTRESGSAAAATTPRPKPQPRRFEIIRQQQQQPRSLAKKPSVETLKRAALSRTTPQLSPTTSHHVETPSRNSANSRHAGHTAALGSYLTGQTNTRSVSVSSNGSESTVPADPAVARNRIMAYVTQLVIGDCLYKYTKGPSLSGITGGRHERFFWIHPQSMTLYWDKDNPAFSSGAVTRMPKCGKILDVEQVTDGNPLPPGLHNFSLIIKTVHRDVKITCPNRTRHRVWYRGLRYLLDQQNN